MQVGQSKRRLPVFIVTLSLLVGSMFLFYNLSSSNLYICPPIGLIGTVKEGGRAAVRAGPGVPPANDPWDWERNGGSPVGQEDKQVAHKYDFQIEGNDVIVFLHMQKTGGTTFGKHLVHDLDLERPCQCAKGRRRCPCIRPGSTVASWQFSRFSMGWGCGLHADWTELQGCVPWLMNKKEGKMVRRRYFYITMLRDPLKRYISEWRHVKRGATWSASRHMCNGREPLPGELPSCFEGREDWMGVSLEEFMTCPHNLANNRQVRMLADLSLVGCYNTSTLSPEERSVRMLESAKTNLRRFAYFGLTEHQKESQYIFEETFNMQFKKPFEQTNDTHANSEPLTDEMQARVLANNALDVALYEYAKALFFERLTYMEEHEGENESS